VGYRFSINEKLSFFGEFGPYFGIGVCGKYNADGFEPNFFDDATSSFVGGKPKRFDVGLGVAVGAEYSKFQLRAGYDFGLTGVWDVSNSAKNRNFYVGVGYMF
jgi:hypothetical protein